MEQQVCGRRGPGTHSPDASVENTFYFATWSPSYPRAYEQPGNYFGGYQQRGKIPGTARMGSIYKGVSPRRGPPWEWVAWDQLVSMGTAGKSRREDGRYQKWSAKKHLIISAILRRHTEDAIGGPAYPARRSPIRGSGKPAVSFPSTPRSLFAEDGKGAPGICLSQGDGKAADLEILEIGKNKTICLGRQRESWSHPVSNSVC
nr:uncharacterized protein LOC105476858 isoform X2 [Macaca nemestrina]